MRISVETKDGWCVLVDESLKESEPTSEDSYEELANSGNAFVYNQVRSGKVNFQLLVEEECDEMLSRSSKETQHGVLRIPSGKLLSASTESSAEIPAGTYGVTLRNVDPRKYQKNNEGKIYDLVGPAARIIGAVGCMPVIGVISLPFAIGTLIQLAKERPDQLASAVPYLLGIPGLLIAIPMLLFRLPQFMGTQKRIKAFWDEMPNAVVELKRLEEDADVPQGRVFTIG